MEEPQRLTVASTWKFDADGVDDIRDRYRAALTSGFCKYEAADDVFAIDGFSFSMPKAASTLAHLLSSFIEEEKDNDLLEKPRITRIVAPAAVDVEHDAHGLDGETEGALIEDTFYPPQAAVLPVVIKYWPESGSGSIDCFTKFSSVLPRLSESTQVSVVLEKENKRIRISSSEHEQVNKVMQMLNNLEIWLSLITSPQVANILNPGNSKELRLMLAVYKDLNDLALRRILADRGSKIAEQLPRMFATSICFVDPENHTKKLPLNVREPPRGDEVRKAGSKLWADFKFKELGDSDNLPELGKVPNPTKEDERIGEFSKAQNNVTEQSVNHPYLSAEKTSIVNKWRTKVEAGAESEENVLPPPEPAFEAAEPPKPLPGLKKRRVAPVAANVQGVAPNPPADRDSSAEVNEGTQLSAYSSAVHVSHTNLNGTPNANEPALVASSKTVNLSQYQPKPNKNPSGELIDLLDAAPATVPGSIGPSMSFSQAPLAPGRRQGLSVNRPGKIQEKPAPEYGSSHAHSNKAADGRIEGTSKPIQGQQLGMSHTHADAIQSQEDLNSKVPAVQPSQNRRIIERQHNASESEVNSRRFHLTMRQKASSTQSKKGSKARQKEKTQAALAEARQAALARAWGGRSLGNVDSSKKASDAPEPSEWKREKMAQDEQVLVDIVNDICTSLEPILNAATGFTGTLHCEIQLGIILIHSVPSSLTDRTIPEKSWNSLLRPKHGVRAPTTNLFNRLTTSGADIDYLFELTAQNDGTVWHMFSKEPLVRTVQYEFYCKTKTDEEIVICVDGSGSYAINRPEASLGAVNVHCPNNIWDMSLVIKGSPKYLPDSDERFDDAVLNLVKNLYVLPNRTDVLMCFKISDGEELTPLKVIMRRTTTHRYAQELYGTNTSRLTPNGHEHSPLGGPKGASNLANGSTPHPSAQNVHLKITEVQNLYLGTTTVDKMLYRARALEPGKMVDDGRLWYEASVVNLDVEDLLKSNEDLELGARAAEWRPCDILGVQGNGPESGNADRPSSAAAHATSKSAHEKLETSILGQMFRIANRVVENIDVVGWANSGPGTDLPTSNFGAATSRIERGNGASALGTAQNVGSTSGRMSGTQLEFW